MPASNLFRCVLVGARAAVLMMAFVLPPQAAAQDQKTLVYLLRHGDDATQLLEKSPGNFVRNCTPSGGCCTDLLNPLGQERALRLGEWFATTALLPNGNAPMAAIIGARAEVEDPKPGSHSARSDGICRTPSPGF